MSRDILNSPDSFYLFIYIHTCIPGSEDAGNDRLELFSRSHISSMVSQAANMVTIITSPDNIRGIYIMLSWLDSKQ